jgi:hypothetical protein
MVGSAAKRFMSCEPLRNRNQKRSREGVTIALLRHVRRLRDPKYRKGASDREAPFRSFRVRLKADTASYTSFCLANGISRTRRPVAA